MKKPFKETKVGKFLSGASQALPESGILGVVRGLLDSDDTLTPEEKIMAEKRFMEAYRIEVQDRDSARKREVGKGGFDFMMNLTGLVGLAAFGFIIYSIAYLEIPEKNKEVWIHLIGIVEGIILSIFGYYFGSAMKKNEH